MDINELRRNSIEERDGFFQPAVFVDLIATAAAGVVGNVIKSKSSGGYVDDLAKANNSICNRYDCGNAFSAKRRDKMSRSIANVSISL